MKKSFFFFCLILSITFLGCSKKQNPTKNGYPQKIITLSPAATEIIYALNAQDQLVAVSDLSDYPAECKEKPTIGGFDGKTINLEVILSYEPDFMYLTKTMHDFMTTQFDSFGIQYYLSDANSLQSLIDEIKTIGKITGHEKEAETVTKNMMESVSNINISDFKTVYYEVWNSPFMSIGKNSFITDILSYAGYTNIFNDVNQDYPIISEEEIITKNPEVILIPESLNLSSDDIKSRKGWNTISAVKNNKVYIINDQIISRPIPRITEEIENLSRLDK